MPKRAWLQSQVVLDSIAANHHLKDSTELTPFWVARKAAGPADMYDMFGASGYHKKFHPLQENVPGDSLEVVGPEFDAAVTKTVGVDDPAMALLTQEPYKRTSKADDTRLNAHAARQKRKAVKLAENPSGPGNSKKKRGG